jgi:ectoine hydroxylase-related dioxygenase (phytanoyl-CoA dioxygenase family)
MPQLTTQQRKSFAENGFLIISGFFDQLDLDGVRAAYDAVWRDRPLDAVVDTRLTNRRIRIKDVTAEERAYPVKVNDLYLRDETLRDIVLSHRIGAILTELFEDDPVIINTLSVEYGTQQRAHLDTLFMTPSTPGKLLATWMALEDVAEDAGPLFYYPESNHIEPYVFEDGGYHVHYPEMPVWDEYMASAVERRGLEKTQFLAKEGDLLIWDAWLLHGGAEICQPGLTRSSLITHYFTKSDCMALRSDVRPTEGGYWMRRPPLPVPGEEQPPRFEHLENPPGWEPSYS